MGQVVRPQHAWVYDEIELEDSPFVVVLPSARLLGFGADSGAAGDYIDLTQIRLPVNVLAEKQNLMAKSPPLPRVAAGSQSRKMARVRPMDVAVARLKHLIETKRSNDDEAAN